MDFHLNSESFRTRLTEILSYGRSVRLQGLCASNLGISSQHFWCKISVTEGCVKTDAFENERSVVPVYTTKQDAKRQDTLRWHGRGRCRYENVLFIASFQRSLKALNVWKFSRENWNRLTNRNSRCRDGKRSKFPTPNISIFEIFPSREFCNGTYDCRETYSPRRIWKCSYCRGRFSPK